MLTKGRYVTCPFSQEEKMTVIKLPGAKDAPRGGRSHTETMILSLEEMDQWVLPPHQRHFRMNKKLVQVAEEIKDSGGILKGIITLGRLPNDPVTYLNAGQHRREACRLSGLKQFLTDVRTVEFNTMAEMATDYMAEQDHIAKPMPDDQLRALEFSHKPLQIIRKTCPFVGYGHVRQYVNGPILGMSVVLRCWHGSEYETPTTSAGAGNATDIARRYTEEDAELLTQFLNVAYDAWSNDYQNNKLWGALNLTMCMWLWRVLVLDTERRGSRRWVVLDANQFKRCLMSLSADDDYREWLVGRTMSDRDRSPCYKRMRALFIKRLQAEGRHPKLLMPQPAWAKA
jgi:hypothetical protein